MIIHTCDEATGTFYIHYYLLQPVGFTLLHRKEGKRGMAKERDREGRGRERRKERVEGYERGGESRGVKGGISYSALPVPGLNTL